MPLAPLKDPWQQVPLVDNTSNEEVSIRLSQLIFLLEEIRFLPQDFCEGGEDGMSGTSEEVYEVTDITKAGHEKASPAQFELLRVLGQGSFGKVTLR